MGTKSLKFWKYYRGPKNIVFSFLSFWGQKDAPGWDDSKSDLKIEIGLHLTPFWPKNGLNLTNLATLPVCERSRRFFGLKGGQMLFSILILSFQFLVSILRLSDSKMKEN